MAVLPGQVPLQADIATGTLQVEAVAVTQAAEVEVAGRLQVVIPALQEAVVHALPAGIAEAEVALQAVAQGFHLVDHLQDLPEATAAAADPLLQDQAVADLLPVEAVLQEALPEAATNRY